MSTLAEQAVGCSICLSLGFPLALWGQQHSLCITAEITGAHNSVSDGSRPLFSGAI